AWAAVAVLGTPRNSKWFFAAMASWALTMSWRRASRSWRPWIASASFFTGAGGAGGGGAVAVGLGAAAGAGAVGRGAAAARGGAEGTAGPAGGDGLAAAAAARAARAPLPGASRAPAVRYSTAPVHSSTKRLRSV